MTEFYDTILEILRQDDRFFAESGAILRNSVYEAAMKMDKNLIKSLYANEKTREKFFIDADDIVVFDKVEFGWVINNREFLPDSYTRYKNKIGLVDNKGQYILNSNDVELVFPYKDCVLEGGQTKDDQKRDEIFYNETLAPDEVDRLLYPKVFTNAKKYTIDGEEEVSMFNDTDNLIIKGNNLLALSSLLKRYEGRIKCIYIDPPYYFSTSKKEDTFAYNSNFKLSTWLTFMKNRLEIAQKLLSEDGAIFVQISDDGVAELHRLMKDIFNVNGSNNFINKITIKTKSPSGFASVNPGVFETAEYVLAFAKNKRLWKYTPQYVASDYDENYKWVIENPNDSYEHWNILSVAEVVAKNKGYETVNLAKEDLGDYVFKNLIADYSLQNAKCVFRYTAIGNDAGQRVVDAREHSKKNKDIIFKVERENQYTIYILNGQELAFYSKKVREIDGQNVPSMQLSNIWMDTPYEGIAKEGNVSLKGGKKPEKLIRRIIEMSTNEKDIVLDFHLGSGTTCAVAHKIGRQYIGVEQLDYGNDDSVVRLKNVIAGDKSGISKVVNWQGGGSFVYCELAKLNQKFVERIEEAKEAETLTSILSDIKATGFISSFVDPKEINPTTDEFEELSLEDKKRLFMELIDKNQLYINYCDIDDEEFAVSENNKSFTKSFYGSDE